MCLTFRNQYICVAPLHCDDASGVQLYWKTQCIQHIYAASLHCESRGALSEFQLCWMILCIGCMCVISLHCELIGVASDFQLCWIIFCIQHSCVGSPHCESGGLIFNVSCPADVIVQFLFTPKFFTSLWRFNLSVNSIYGYIHVGRVFFCCYDIRHFQ